MKKNTIFIQNIVSPYRNRFFNVLNKYMTDFSVYYMSKSEPDRSWDVDKMELKYNHWIDEKGKYFTIGWFRMHFNPRLVWKILRDKNAKNIILAVSWTDPNIMAICFARRLHLTNKRLFFWAEANYTAEWSKKHNSKFKWLVKRAVFNSVDGAMIIPGKMAKISFEKWNIRVKNFIYNPNTIDDFNLIYNPTLRHSGELPIFILPIRLIEHIKGALNFFDAIGEENVRCAKFIIAGDGVDEEKYKIYISEHNYQDNIILAGFCDSIKMTELYNNANAMLLPSFSDPSPLSLVEALYFHLPVLCSNHCGNHFEVVEEGKNGYTFSPLDKDDIKKHFEIFMSKRNDWFAMGELSAKLYSERFDTEKTISRFIEQYENYKK